MARVAPTADGSPGGSNRHGSDSAGWRPLTLLPDVEDGSPEVEAAAAIEGDGAASGPTTGSRRRLLAIGATVAAALGVVAIVESNDAGLSTGLARFALNSITQEFYTAVDEDGLRPWPEAKRLAAQKEAQLTPAERAGLLSGLGFPAPGDYVGETKGVPRLGIPPLIMQDSSGGFRPMLGPDEYGTVTSWPSLLSMAATWDPIMVSKVATAIAVEFKGKGANVLLGPGLNVHRTPFGGRNWEYISGEDPKLGAVLGAAYIKAVQKQGVMAVAKHFAFNEQETHRGSENSIVDDRTMWELYMPPFEAAIEAGVGAMMCSYNRFNGSFACESQALLKQTLKGAMGFNGFVLSDWDAIKSSAALEAGTDMEQPRSHFLSPEMLSTMNPVAVADSARRVLGAIYRLRLDERPTCTIPCEDQRAANQHTEVHANLAEEAAAGSIVLLQNKGVLPINTNIVKKILIIGAAAVAEDTQNTWGEGSPYSGGGSGHVPAPIVVTPEEAIKQRALIAGMEVMTSADISYKKSAALEASEVASRRRLKQLDELAQSADLIIVVGATTATESVDRPSLSLDDGVDDIIRTVSVVKPTVVLLEVPGAVWTPWRDQTAAIACMFLGGERTGSAWASMLFGDIAPAGKLPITMPGSEFGIVHPGMGDIVYSEGLATGYRSIAAAQGAAFSFGHGLTFTTFRFSKPMSFIKGCGAAVCVVLNVTNTGGAVGREVVQAYVHFYGALGRDSPSFLRAFHKTSELSPGAQEVVTLRFTSRDLSTYDEGLRDWVQHEKLSLRLGASSADIRQELFLDVPAQSSARGQALTAGRWAAMAAVVVMARARAVWGN